MIDPSHAQLWFSYFEPVEIAEDRSGMTQSIYDF